MRVEKIRQTVRSILGYDSMPYRFFSRLADFMAVSWHEGIPTWYRLMRLNRIHSNNESTADINLKNLIHPMTIRPATEDIGTIINNVVRQEYGQYDPVVPPRLMLDAGAYIGDTTAYFLSRYPELKVIALEPDPSNLSLAKKNLLPYEGRCVVDGRGLWGKDESIHIGGNYTSASIGQNGTAIQGVSVMTLLSEYDIDRLDILKMDVEGAEAEVFAADVTTWLDRVECLIIEFHGDEMEQNITHLLVGHGFLQRKFRSLSYYTR